MSLVTLAASCPDCQVGRDARALFFASDLAAISAFALAPFLVTLLVAWLVVRRLDRPH